MWKHWAALIESAMGMKKGTLIVQRRKTRARNMNRRRIRIKRRIRMRMIAKNLGRLDRERW
jgi:hypothetical protein